MAFCLPREEATKFKEALRGGKIVPEELSAMTSAERRAFFQEIVGENAQSVNALFESKLLLKDQKRGLVTWAKKVAGITEATRKDLLTRIEKLEKFLDAESKQAFLEDLAEQKLGAKVSFEQADTIVKLADDARQAKEKIPENAADGSPEALEYGLKLVRLQNYIRELKGEDFNAIKEFKGIKNADDALEFGGKAIYETLGTAKSLLSSIDNSFFGRQGIPVLATNPTIWLKSFLKSFGDIARELKGINGMDLVKADIFSRKNARNGMYEKMKLDIGTNAEEAFPSSLPGKVPGLGRLYKASETAFQAGALRMRADIADRLLARAERMGVDTNVPEVAKSIGSITNSLTGRGGLGRAEPFGKDLNVWLFSPKFLAANFNTLTAHRFGMEFPRGAARNFARRVAAENLVKLIGTLSAVYFVAETLQPGSVEWDPRSSKYGKIKIGNTYFDITGGKGGLATLASRFTPTKHGDKGGLFGDGWGFWFKSATTGKWTDLTAGKYGQMDGIDILTNFWSGKLAPIPGLYRDLLRGENFQGQEVTPYNAILGLVTPLTIQSTIQRQEVQPLATPEGVAGLILEGLGLSASTYEKRK